MNYHTKKYFPQFQKKNQLELILISKKSPLFYKKQDIEIKCNSIEDKERARVSNGEKIIFFTKECREVLKESIDFLCQDGKDLQLAKMIGNALIRLESFAGLAKGLELFEKLIDTFGNKLQSKPSSGYSVFGEYEYLFHLHKFLIDKSALDIINFLPILSGSEDQTDYRIYHLIQAVMMEGQSIEYKESMIKDGYPDLKMLKQFIVDSGFQIVREQKEDIENCLSNMRSLSKKIDSIWPKNELNFSKMREKIENTQKMFASIAGEYLENQSIKQVKSVAVMEQQTQIQQNTTQHSVVNTTQVQYATRADSGSVVDTPESLKKEYAAMYERLNRVMPSSLAANMAKIMLNYFDKNHLHMMKKHFDEDRDRVVFMKFIQGETEPEDENS